MAASGGAAQAALAAELAAERQAAAAQLAAERALLEPFVAARLLRRAGWGAPRVDLAVGGRASGEAVAGEGHRVLQSASFFDSWGDDEDECAPGWHDDGERCFWRELGACVCVEEGTCVVIPA